MATMRVSVDNHARDINDGHSDDDIEMTRQDAGATWNRSLGDNDAVDGNQEEARTYSAHASPRRSSESGSSRGDVIKDDDEIDPMADVIRCAVRERTCVPRLGRRWALVWAVLGALAVAAIVLGPWFGERLGPQWALANGARERVCTVLNHTILETRFQQDGGMAQVPGIGVRLASVDGRGAGKVAMARPRLLYCQSWMSALLVPAYWNVYPVGTASTCHEHQTSGTVAMRDGIDGLGAETVLCVSMAAGAAVGAFACLYRVLGPRALAAPYGTI
ncbi:hypothetical protein pkur_cds_284 [Pandoravirus kuranda]|uniref:Uncharacterized protein n=1 Tax=Pandoravirus kuranda TaxID=3019033 RepID=A0AA95J237_9VIRU|nr:hypothetical protein pkur_cds_284 [Pandoravirus kuranda]